MTLSNLPQLDDKLAELLVVLNTPERAAERGLVKLAAFFLSELQSAVKLRDEAVRSLSREVAYLVECSTRGSSVSVASVAFYQASVSEKEMMIGIHSRALKNTMIQLDRAALVTEAELVALGL